MSLRMVYHCKLQFVSRHPPVQRCKWVWYIIVRRCSLVRRCKWVWYLMQSMYSCGQKGAGMWNRKPSGLEVDPGVSASSVRCPDKRACKARGFRHKTSVGHSARRRRDLSRWIVPLGAQPHRHCGVDRQCMCPCLAALQLQI